MYYALIAIAGIFIAAVVAFQMITHFHFCRRVSEKYPGEKIEGCPIWTQKQVKQEGEKETEKETG